MGAEGLEQSRPRLAVDTPAPPTQQGPAALMAQCRVTGTEGPRRLGVGVEGSLGLRHLGSRVGISTQLLESVHGVFTLSPT